LDSFVGAEEGEPPADCLLLHPARKVARASNTQGLRATRSKTEGIMGGTLSSLHASMQNCVIYIG
jgi:hypothetical protein